MKKVTVGLVITVQSDPCSVGLPVRGRIRTLGVQAGADALWEHETQRAEKNHPRTPDIHHPENPIIFFFSHNISVWDWLINMLEGKAHISYFFVVVLHL